MSTRELETLTYFVGDTLALGFRIRSAAGEDVDVTGSTFRLTINRRRHPVDAADQIVQLSGTIVDAAEGRVAFGVSANAWNSVPRSDFQGGVASFFYDIEWTDGAGVVKTFGVGRFLLARGITQ